VPAVLTIKEGGVVPRYPSVPGRIRAKKAPVDRVAPTVRPVGNGRLLLTLPPEETKTVEILGRGADAAPAVVDLFERLGLVGR
jgi:electron transfer flavoprotein beta subunit